MTDCKESQTNSIAHSGNGPEENKDDKDDKNIPRQRAVRCENQYY